MSTTAAPTRSALTAPRFSMRSLSDVRPAGPCPEEPLDLGLLVFGSKVQVKQVLGVLGFWHRHEEQPG
jgi:hypothetical protein